MDVDTTSLGQYQANKSKKYTLNGNDHKTHYVSSPNKPLQELDENKTSYRLKEKRSLKYH